MLQAFYSHGVRQALFERFSGTRPDIALVPRGPTSMRSNGATKGARVLYPLPLWAPLKPFHDRFRENHFRPSFECIGARN